MWQIIKKEVTANREADTKIAEANSSGVEERE